MYRAESVEDFFAKDSQWQNELLELRKILISTDFVEDIKWGMPSYGLDKQNLVGVGAFNNWFCLWFHQGALLSDSKKVLLNAQEGKTQGMRQWRMKSMEDIDEKAIRAYLEETIDHHRSGRTVIMLPKEKKVKEAIRPSKEWITFMTKNPSIASNFSNYTDKQQLAFIEYISEAKQVKTKLSRLERLKPVLEAGKPIAALWS